MTERELQKAGTDLLKQLGFDVSNLSQGFRPGGRRHGSTRQRPGLPDTYCRHVLKRLRFWIEWKGPETRVTDHQRSWHELEAASGGTVWIVRSVGDLCQILRGYGFQITQRSVG